ncbi:MAG: 16S rRNA (adenine(1518)-N(6)/adenine(1519)-N(6))-dimethyltransferase RsmA [Actinomycetes bacterium]
MTLSRPQAAALLADNGLAPQRSLGQNFVVDPNTVRKIARIADVRSGDIVLEIGAGLGSLTAALAETGAQVIAVEVDRGIVPVLREQMAGIANVEVVEADAMTLNWHEFLADINARHNRSADATFHLVANLPYNIATPLVADLLDGVPAIQSMLVMVQSEVGERLCAPAGTEAYGALSVKIAYWANAQIAGSVPPTVFLPRPKVDSALVKIVRHATLPLGDVAPEALFQLVRTGFAKRRKMLRSALAGVVTAEQFVEADVEATLRAEQLDLAAWGRLARVTHPLR